MFCTDMKSIDRTQMTDDPIELNINKIILSTNGCWRHLKLHTIVCVGTCTILHCQMIKIIRRSVSVGVGVCYQ